MKTKIFILLASIVCMVSCRDGLWNAIDELNDKYDNLDGRVTKLEEKCKEMNTNISSLQTLVSVILNNDYIVSITPIMKENKEIGYTITFAIHAPITIYHGQNGADGKDGQNGKDGENGKDGKDGVTPIIGVAQDEEDHAYYWTLNGEWLLDVNGNRIPLTSRDGKDGKDGQDGKPGQNGQDGKDGITPQLKIENGYWYVSTDSGSTWIQLGKAVGENGQDGKDGKDGKDGADGDSMFESVTQDDDFVYFTLVNGTVLTVSKYKDDSVKIIDGAIVAEFSVSDTKKVYFSMGNLRYEENDSTIQYWFTESQDDKGSSFIWSSQFETYIYVQNGGNLNNEWRLLTSNEWYYIQNNSMYIYAEIYPKGGSQSIRGLVLFPNNYQPIPINRDFTYTIYGNLWEEWQAHGVIFIPLYSSLFYWTPEHYTHSSYSGIVYIHNCIMVSNNGINFKVGDKQITNYQETRGYIRLVKDVE